MKCAKHVAQFESPVLVESRHTGVHAAKHSLLTAGLVASAQVLDFLINIRQILTDSGHDGLVGIAEVLDEDIEVRVVCAEHRLDVETNAVVVLLADKSLGDAVKFLHLVDRDESGLEIEQGQQAAKLLYDLFALELGYMLQETACLGRYLHKFEGVLVIYKWFFHTKNQKIMQRYKKSCIYAKKIVILQAEMEFVHNKML